MSDDRPEYETWRVNVPGTVGVMIYDPNARSYRQQRVSGSKGSPILRISAEDREHNELSARDRDASPFHNGMLVRVESDGEVAKEHEQFTDDHLTSLLNKRKRETFAEAVAELDELRSRKLYELAQDDGKTWQVEVLEEHLEQWRPGGTQRAVAEMYGDGDLATEVE